METNHITSTDTIWRMWTVSDNCDNSTSHKQVILINPSRNLIFTDTICAGNHYDNLGFSLLATTDTVLEYRGHTVNGCDSIVTLHLTVYQPTDTTIVQTINQGNLPYVLNDISYNQEGTYTQTIPNQNGCDSTITLILHVRSTIFNTVDSSLCENDLPLIWNDVTFTETGSQTITLQNAEGAAGTA